MTAFDLKDKIDRQLYWLFNLISELIFYISFSKRRKVSKNKRFKDIHKNRECYIIGTGPSVNQIDEEIMADISSKDVFAVNSFYKIEKMKSIVPKYYVLLDNLYWEDWSGTFLNLSQLYGKSLTFISDLRAERFISQTGKGKSILLYTKKYPYRRIDARIDKNMFIGNNVVTTAILCAIYMGYNKINLLGTDYNAFCNQGSGHAYDDKNEVSQTNYNLAFYLKFYWITTEIHYLVAKFALKRNVRIVNSCKQSLLDAYPRV